GECVGGPLGLEGSGEVIDGTLVEYRRDGNGMIWLRDHNGEWLPTYEDSLEKVSDSLNEQGDGYLKECRWLAGDKSGYRILSDVYTGRRTPEEAAAILQRPTRWRRLKAWLRGLLVKDT